MTDIDTNARLVVGHFEDFVNRRDLDAIERNVAEGFVDHDGPGGKIVERWATVTPMHALAAEHFDW